MLIQESCDTSVAFIRLRCATPQKTAVFEVVTILTSNVAILLMFRIEIQTYKSF